MGKEGVMEYKTGGLIVDLGNVIIAHWLSNITSSNFDEVDYNLIPEVPGAFASLKKFCLHFEGNISVIYNATDIASEKIIEWLHYHRFVEQTGISLDRVMRSKTGRDKTPYLSQRSGSYHDTSIVIDDRLEVLAHFVGKVPYLFLFRPREDEIAAFSRDNILSQINIVTSWPELELALRL